MQQTSGTIPHRDVLIRLSSLMAINVAEVLKSVVFAHSLSLFGRYEWKIIICSMLYQRVTLPMTMYL